MLRVILIKTLLLLFSVSVMAQNITETQWFFGNDSSNLQIDKNGDLAYLENRMATPFGTGGSTVISDHLTGNLIFYSDGQRVYDASHQLLASNLSGDPRINQPAVSCPVPGNDGRYYIFTNSGASGPNQIQYTTVNSLASGNGSAIAPLGEIDNINNPTALDNPSEGMILIPNPDRTSYWLITQHRTNFDFRVSRIVDGGIDSTAVFELDTITRPGFEAAHFAYNDTTGQIAVAPKSSNRNVWILNFNDITGQLQFIDVIRNTGFSDDQNESIYDVEWSSSGQFLYISRYGGSTENGNLYQYDFMDTTETLVPIVENGFFRSYGLKKGIDDRIYHLYQEANGEPFLLARLETPEESARDQDTTLNFEYRQPLLEEDFNGRQFPAFAPPPFFEFDSVAFTYLDSCENDDVKFFPIVEPTPASYRWSINGNPFSNASAPILQDITPGQFVVSLTVSLNGIDSTYSELVNITQNDLEIDLGADTVICVDELLELDADPDNQGVFYVWNTGETTRTIEVDTTGTYWVEVTSTTGCTSFDAITVTEYGIQRQVANQWYFGEMAGLDFNQQPTAAIADANMMFSAEGCATISDEDGNLLFYTNGSTVWNRDHEIMQGGTNIGGDSTASQGVVILPFAEEETMFYVFTAKEVYGDLMYDMRYSIVDMKKDLSLGAVVLKDLPFFQNSIEKVTASGFDAPYFVVGHEFGNNSFRINLVTDLGIGPTVFSPMGEQLVLQEPSEATGYMRFAPGAENFVNLIPGRNVFEIFDLEDTVNTRRFFNSRLIDTEESSDLYGLEFSTDGLNLAISTSGSLIAYNLDSLDTDNEISDIINTKVTETSLSNYGALQVGSDQQIYLAVDNSPSVYTVNLSPNTISINQPIDLLGRTSRLGLPNFTQSAGNVQQQPGFLVENLCFGQPVEFTGSGTSQIDLFEWDFDLTGDRAIPPNGLGPEVTTEYDTTGVFTVELRVYNRCAQDHPQGPGESGPELPPLDPPFSIDTLLTRDIEIFPIPEIPLVPDDTSLCNGPVLLTAWDEDRPDLNYYWSNGDTSRTITLTEPALLDVAIINDDGCSSDTLAVFVGDGRPQIDLGPDQAYCQFDDIPPLDAQNVQVFYEWTLDGEEVGDTRFQPVNDSIPGTFEYAIRVEEPANACVGTDTIEITIRETPDVITDFTDPSDCGVNDATFEFTVNSLGNFLYYLQNPDTILVGTVDGPSNPGTFSELGVGTYAFTVENLVSGCTFQEGIFIEDDVLFDLTASNLPDCNSAANIQLTLTGAALPERTNVLIENAIGDSVFNQNNLRPPLLISPELDSGLYFVSVEDVSNGCIQSDSVLVQPIVAGPNDCLPFILAPNAFSPNGNGQNEEFYIIPNPFIDEFEIFIYTRWGELVFYSENINFRWDGRFNNQLLPVGTYAYIIKYTSVENPQLGEQSQYGQVTLIR